MKHSCDSLGENQLGWMQEDSAPERLREDRAGRCMYNGMEVKPIILVANTPYLSIYLLIKQILTVCQLLTRCPASGRYRQTKMVLDLKGI